VPAGVFARAGLCVGAYIGVCVGVEVSEQSSDVASQHVPSSAGVCLRACVCVYVCVRVGADVHVFLMNCVVCRYIHRSSNAMGFNWGANKELVTPSPPSLTQIHTHMHP